MLFHAGSIIKFDAHVKSPFLHGVSIKLVTFYNISTKVNVNPKIISIFVSVHRFRVSR